MRKNNRHHHARVHDEEPSETPREQTARLAYQLWEQRGRPSGNGEEDWYKAEREIERQREAATRL